MRDPCPRSHGDSTATNGILHSSRQNMTEVAWDDSRIAVAAAQGSSGGVGPRPQLAALSQPQRSRDDAMVGYFSQRQGNEMGDGNQYQKRWAVGDDSVIDQRAGGEVNKMAGEFQNMQISGGDQRGRNMEEPIVPPNKKIWESGDDGKGDISFLSNQWAPSNAWGNAPSEHSVSQPIMVQQRGPGRGLSPGTFQGPENQIMSPRSDTSGLGLSMAEYVLASSPQGPGPQGKDPHHRRAAYANRPEGVPQEVLEQQQAAKNGSKKSKTPSPFEGDGDKERPVENNTNGNPQKGPEEDAAPYSARSHQSHGSRNPSPTEGEEAAKAAAQAAAAAAHNPGINPSNQHPPDQQQRQQYQQQQRPQQHQQQHGGEQGGFMDQNTVQNQLQIDTSGGGAMEGGVNMDPLQFDYSQQQQMVPSMDSPSYIDYNQTQMFQQRQANPQAIAIQQLTPQQQQQYAIAAAQQQQLAFAAPNPYIIAGATQTGQDPYTLGIATVAGGQTVVQPQYYGVAPWSAVYPVNIIPQQQQAQGGQQPGTPQGQPGTPQPGQQPQGTPMRGQNGRPMTPQQGQQGQQQQGDQAGGQQGQQQQLAQLPAGYQVIAPAYYDQSGALIMGNPRPGQVGPVRLVSPAPVIVSSAQAVQGQNGQANGVRLISQAQQAQQQGPAALSMYGGSPVASNVPHSNSAASSLYGQQSSSVFSNGSMGSSVGPIGTGLGSSSDMTGQRRDSLTGSDYKRQNISMSQFYGSSPQLGPIGMPSSGSLTPPPGQSTLSGLGLGVASKRSWQEYEGLTDNLLTAPSSSWGRPKSDWGGRAVNPAAPFGSEVNYRTSTGSPSAWSNTLFPPRSLRSSAYMEKSAPGRSRLLEDFRNNRFPNLQLRDLSGHIVEFSQDQHGSRFIQQKLERASPAERQMVFNEILGAAYSLMTDVFGNYVIQKFFEFGTTEQKQALAQRIRGHVLPLALQMYGCRVIQKALESIPPEHQIEMVQELDGHVLKCVKDQNGNHVVQKCIECVEPVALQYIVDSFHSQVFSLSTHPYGCRVIQRILEHCTIEQTKPLLDELHEHTESLVQDQYGNYVIQHVLEHGRPEDKSKIVAELRGKVLSLAQHKFASNVVEKCVTHSSRPERALLIDEVCSFNDGSNHSALFTMMKDQYANYVVQKMIDVAEPNQRKILMHKIRPHVSTLRKFTYGKHILAKLEKFFLKNSSDLGPIGPIGGPPNGAL